MSHSYAKPKLVRMTIVSVRKDEERNAYLIKAEGPFGMRMSWFTNDEPREKPGDEFSIKFIW